jgi:hypothetical protein
LYAIYESGGNADLTSDALLGSLKPSVPARRLFRFFAIYAYRTRIDFIYPDDAATTNQTLNGGQLNEHVTYRLNDDCATTTTSNYSILLLLLFVGEISFANIYIYICIHTRNYVVLGRSSNNFRNKRPTFRGHTVRSRRAAVQ